MKHYLWYKTTGIIGGELVYQGGWPAEADPSDDENTHPDAVRNRELMEAQPDYSGIVAYTCACDAEDEFCGCAASRVNTHYVTGGTLTAKETVACIVDSVSKDAVNDEASAYDKTPGATVTLTLEADVPDDTTVTLKNCFGVTDIISGDEVLTFTDGETNSIDLTTPPHGFRGGVYTEATLELPRTRVVLRGWTA